MKEFDKKIAGKLNRVDQTPDPVNFEMIKARLDAEKLYAEPKKSLIKAFLYNNTAVAASLVILLSLGGFALLNNSIFVNPETGESISSSIERPVSPSFDLNINSEIPLNNASPTQNSKTALKSSGETFSPSLIDQLTAELTADASIEQLIPTKQDLLSNKDLSTQKVSAFDREKQEDDLVLPPYKMSLIASATNSLYNLDESYFNQVDSMIAATTRVRTVNGFSFGPIAEINKHWMIFTKDQLEPIEGEQNIYRSSIGNSYGMSFAYDFKNPYGLQADLRFARSSQEFTSTTSEGKNIEGAIRTRYIKIPVLFRHRLPTASKWNGKTQSINYIIGLEYDHLISATIQENDLITPAQEKFNAHELGFVLGIEYDLFLNESTYLSLGARTSITGDAKNFPIVTGNENGKPINLVIGANASLKFLAKKKR